jgi:putative flippase GtrA
MRGDVGLETRREHDQAALSNATMSDERPAPALLRRARGHAPRFLKYGTVGASGVLVNMGGLFLLADAIGIHTNLAALLAIECSVLNNFVWNEVWTFRDRRVEGQLLARAGRFHLVSIVAVVVQVACFVLLNLLWFRLNASPAERAAYFSSSLPLLEQVTRPLLQPPDVGALKYISQAAGIGLAVIWNFSANLRWTWSARAAEDSHVR